MKRINWENIIESKMLLFQEGTICIYDHDMQSYKQLEAPTANCKLRDLWITDFVFMPNNNKIALAYTSKEISKTFHS